MRVLWRLSAAALLLQPALTAASCGAHGGGMPDGTARSHEPAARHVAADDAGDACADATPQPDDETSTVLVPPVTPPQPSVVVTVTPPGFEDGAPPP
jgi:hypothetical protein